MRESNPKLTRRASVAAQFAWWAPSYLIAAAGLAGGIGSLLTGQPVAVAVCSFVIVVIAGSSQIRTRREYRRGWRHGYESAIRTALQYQAGKGSAARVGDSVSQAASAT